MNRAIPVAASLVAFIALGCGRKERDSDPGDEPRTSHVPPEGTVSADEPSDEGAGFTAASDSTKANTPAGEPAAEPAAEPAKEPAAEPAKEPAKEPAAEPVVTAPAPVPVTEPAPVPVTEPAPVPAPAPVPVTEPAPVPAPAPVVAAASKRLVAYYATWTRAAMPPKSIAWSRVTHIAHAFVLPSTLGGLKNVSTYVDPELIAEAHAHGVKVVASVGGWGANFDANVDPVIRAKTVAALAALCKTHHYDGIDIDWEFPTAATAPAWAALVSELRVALDAINPNLELAAAISAGRANMAVLPKAALAKLSFIGVMTYDFSGPWSASIGHHAPLYPTKGGDGGSTSGAIDYLVKTVGVASDKLLFGLPFYGYQFAGSTLESTAVAPGGGVDYNKLAPLVGAQGYTRGFDATGKVPFLTRPASPGFVSYDDDTSIAAKCTWSKSRELGGAIIWHLAGDKMTDGSQPLLTAAQACR